MNAKPVRNKKTGLKGWKYRYTTPAGKRTKITIHISERREADRAFQEHMNRVNAKAAGLPDHSGLLMPYNDLATRFITEILVSDRRKKELKKCLSDNLLCLRTGADLMNVGSLSTACPRLIGKYPDVYLRQYVQQPIKQLASWAASVGLLPYNALTAWNLIPRTSKAKRRRAFLPDEMQFIFNAAEELDKTHMRSVSTALVFKALLLTGSRPTALFQANVGNLDGHRIVLHEGNGKKRNGMCTLPLPFIAEIKQTLSKRGNPAHTEALFLSRNGGRARRVTMRDAFRRCMVLAFVRMEWPKNDRLAATVDPLQVAYRLHAKRLQGFDGPQPTNELKRKAREQKARDIETMAQKIEGEVSRRLEQRDMYTLRATHISWARQIANRECVMLQVGHSPRDVEDRHYLDLVDARDSSQAVWDVLTGQKALKHCQPSPRPL